MVPATPVNVTPAVVSSDTTDPRYWTVEWFGKLHGGRHFDYQDAQAHAADLNALPDFEHEQWACDHYASYHVWLQDHGYGVTHTSDLVETMPAETHYVIGGSHHLGHAVQVLDTGRHGGWTLVRDIETGARFTVPPGGLLADARPVAL